MNIVCACEINEDSDWTYCPECGRFLGGDFYQPPRTVEPVKKISLTDGLTAKQQAELIKSGFRF